MKKLSRKLYGKAHQEPSNGKNPGTKFVKFAATLVKFYVAIIVQKFITWIA